MLIARSLLAVLSLLLTAPSQCLASRNKQLASYCFIFAFRYYVLISHTLPLAAQCFLDTLLVITWMIVIFNFLFSSNSLFAGINSKLFIGNRYCPPTARLSCSLLADSQMQLADSLSLLAVCCFPLPAPPSHLVEQNICSFLSALGPGTAKSEKL